MNHFSYSKLKMTEGSITPSEVFVCVTKGKKCYVNSLDVFVPFLSDVKLLDF